MQNPRLLILGGVIAVLVMANLVSWVWSNWGLVTLNYQNAPLQEVMESLEKQAGIQIRTNLDPATPVTVRIKKKTFTEALDALAGSVPGEREANWRLAYIMAPSKEEIGSFFATWTSGERPNEWRWIGRGGWGGGGGGGFGGMGGGISAFEEEGPVDPRSQVWNVQPVETGELQVFLQQGNVLTDAMFVVPSAWNPKVESLPSGGKVQKLAQKMASSANGQAEEIFLLIGDTRPVNNEPRPQGENQGQGPRGPATAGFGPQQNDQMAAWRDQRTQERLAKLPMDKKVEAQAELDQRRAMMEEMRKLTPEQRMAKMQEMMNDPAMQEKMDEQQSKRDSRSTPDQRLKRFKRYVDRKRELSK